MEIWKWQMKKRFGKKTALYLRVNVLAQKHLLGTLFFTPPFWRWDHHFMWSSEPCEDPAICRAKSVPSFVSYFKTQSIDLAQGNIKPTTSCSSIRHSTNWANPAAIVASRRQWGIEEKSVTQYLSIRINFWNCIIVILLNYILFFLRFWVW